MKIKNKLNIIILYLKKISLLNNKKDNKYAILLHELKKEEKKAKYAYEKLISLENIILTKNLQQETLNKEYLNILHDILSYVKISAHYIYENKKDLENNSLLLTKEYLKNIEYPINILFTLASLEKQNIDINKINNVNDLMKILNCEYKVKENPKKETQEIIEKFHQNYMNNYIYNKIENKEIKLKEIKNTAKKISKKKINN